MILPREALFVLPICLGVAGACSAGDGASSTPEPATGGGAATSATGAAGGTDPGTGGTGAVAPLLDAGGTVDPSPPGAPPRECAVCSDLPADPIYVEGTPPEAADYFGAPDNVTMGAGPCIAEPAPDTLFPNNWLRPRIRWNPSGNLYEVRIENERQTHDLVVYTTRTEYYIPREIWNGVAGVSQGLAKNNYEEDIIVTVRSVDTAAPGVPGGSQTVFRTAAVDAGGSLVYWAMTSSLAQDSWLMGFAVGDEAAIDTLRQNQLTSQTRGYAAQPKDVTCIGCHTSTPDGDAVAFVDDWAWAGALAYVTEERVGELPDYVTPAGLLPFQQLWEGVPTFSGAQWADGARMAIITLGDPTGVGWPADDGLHDFNATNQDRLMWVNLAASGPEPVPTDPATLAGTYIQSAEGQSYGFLARNGDSRAAIAPDWSNDGTQVAYTSTSTTSDGCIGAVNDTDVYVVPWGDGAGGDAVPAPGASQLGVGEYYPSFSSDDAFVAFNRVDNVAALTGNLYYRPEGEVWIAPAPGLTATPAADEISVGGAIRLKANDPQACSGEVSPGVINSWPKWSPRVSEVAGKRYYWLIFSSAREAVGILPPSEWSPPDTRYSQLYMAAFTVENGEVTTYPAIYLWNQSTNTSNLTPAWDEFDIPEVPLPEVPH